MTVDAKPLSATANRMAQRQWRPFPKRQPLAGPITCSAQSPSRHRPISLSLCSTQLLCSALHKNTTTNSCDNGHEWD